MPFTDVPPSYDSSISRETWTVVAPYISSADLCACCLVSRKWHSIFIPFLWGDPASHFGIANDAVYVALTRFKKTLRKARASVRGLTHTLHLPPALSEIYGGPHATWLRDVLEYLPNLQSLIVSKLPFFDHHSLAALRTTSRVQNNDEWEDELPFFSLKLLLANSEPNTTSIGLATALPRFPNLVYLDLSYTKPARDAAVLMSLKSLHDLQALKLRGVGIRDGEAEVLANSIGIRVRLLDVRDNHLTDMAVRSLMQACFIPPDRTSVLNPRRVEDWPVGMAPGPDFFSLDTLRSEELDRELLKQLTNPLTGRLAFEDIPHRGLTHLYIAGNQLSVEGLSSLLKSQRLHVLDGGTVDAVKTILRSESMKSPTGYIDEVNYPGAEKLIPILAQSASKNLTYLRVDHAVVTKTTEPPLLMTTASAKSSVVELAGSSPLAAELPAQERVVNELPAPAHYAAEMPTSETPIFEMDATPALPRYELPGDIIHFAVSPPVGEAPEMEITEASPAEPIRGEGAYAPEVVPDETATHRSEGSDKDRVSDQSSTNGTGKSIMSPVSPIVPAQRFQSMMAPVAAQVQKTQTNSAPTAPKQPQATTNGHVKPPGPSLKQLRIDYLVGKRPKELSSLPKSSNAHFEGLSRMAAAKLTHLHPAVLPNIRTLTLTDLPTTIPASSPILPQLKQFISACAAELALSHLLAQTDYSLPPGRARYMAEHVAAKRLFALSCITLEMVNATDLNRRQSTHRAWEHSRQRLSMSKSSTGDRDSENLWSAAADDFSFFNDEGGEEEDECGIYDHEKDKYFPTANTDEKMLVTGDDGYGNGSGNRTPSGSFKSLNLSPVHALRTATLRSPRELPLGRNRRSSNEAQRGERIGMLSARPATPELMGNIPPAVGMGLRFQQQAPTSFPTSQPQIPTSYPTHLARHTSIKSERSISPPTPEEEQIDLIAELAKWRKERKAAFETEMNKFQRFRHGLQADVNKNGGGVVPEEVLPPFVEGYWKGEVKVVRNAAPKGRSGVVDMYGNYFEKGYLYP